MIHLERSQKTKEVNDNEQVAIIGGGITGLFTGYFLVKKGYKVILFEKENHAGGALSTFPVDKDISLEKFYHHILSFNKDLLSFLQETGFANNLIRKNCSIGIIKDQTVTPVNSLRQIALLKGMSFMNLLKSCWLGVNILLSPGSKKWDTITAEDLITRYCGTNIWQQMCYPMIRSKFGDRYKDISGLWLVNKLRQKILVHKENSGEKLIYLKGSFQLLINYLEKYIVQSGSRIEYEARVERTVTENNRVSALMVNGKKYRFNKVISTIAEPHLDRIISKNKNPGDQMADPGGPSSSSVNRSSNPGERLSNPVDPMVGIRNHMVNQEDQPTDPEGQLADPEEQQAPTKTQLTDKKDRITDPSGRMTYGKKQETNSGSKLENRITYSHSLCTVLRLKRKVSDFYWLYNLDETIPFAALIEHTNLTGLDLYKGESILYIARYLDSKHDLYRFSNKQVIDDYIPWLKKLFPEFDKKDIIERYVFRQPYAQPIFDRGYLDKKPPPQTSLDGLYSVNMSQLFPQERTLENCFLLARKFTERF